MPSQDFPIKLTAFLFYGNLILAAAVTSVGYAAQQRWDLAVTAVIIAGLTILAHVLGHGRRIIGVMLASLVVLLAVGLWQELPPRYALVGGAAALIAWDLFYFRQRLDRVDRAAHPAALVRNHLKRLALAVSLGILLGGLGLTLRVQVGLGSILLLALILVWGISRAIKFLRRESD